MERQELGRRRPTGRRVGPAGAAGSGSEPWIGRVEASVGLQRPPGGGAGTGEADLRKSGSWRGRGEAGAGPAEGDWATSTACRGRREQERALERPSRGQPGSAESAGRRSWAWRGCLKEVWGMETPLEGRSRARRGHRGARLQDVWGLQRPRRGSWAGAESKEVVVRPEIGPRPQQEQNELGLDTRPGGRNWAWRGRTEEVRGLERPPKGKGWAWRGRSP